MPQIMSEAQLLRAHAVSPMGPDAHADKASDDAPMEDIIFRNNDKRKTWVVGG